MYVKYLNINGECFKYLIATFHKTSLDKIKAGVFDRPQIRNLIRDKKFLKTMNNKEKAVCLSFVAVMRNFLGSRKAENCKMLVSTMLTAVQNLGCNMSIKLLFLRSQLYEFPESLGALSDGQRERFHQDFKTMEHLYQGRWDKMMWQITAGALSETVQKRFTSAKATNANSCQNRVLFLCCIVFVVFFGIFVHNFFIVSVYVLLEGRNNKI